MSHETEKRFPLLIIAIALIGFVYVTAKAITIVNKRQIGTPDGIYSNYVSNSEEIKELANRLTKGCQSELCKSQQILNYVTNIPYKINNFQAHSPKRTLELGFGDCDDKSNLLISLLHASDIESYFVLVPEHIFVIVAIEDSRLANAPALVIDGKKYYILESTAKNSRVGFPIKYKVEDIGGIIDPFENERFEYGEIRTDA